MKNPELFHKTISILVKAYQKGNLEHGNCSACAVGNIVSHANWKPYFCTAPEMDKLFLDDHEKIIREDNDFIQVGVSTIKYLKQKRDSGYTYYELSKIEWAFETAPEDGDWELNGLMAVVDALMIIHKATNKQAKEAKLLFVK